MKSAAKRQAHSPGHARPPGPRGLPFLGSFLAFRSDRAGFLLETSRRYGELAHFRAGALEIYLVSDPEEIGRVLVREHRKFRKSPATQRMRLLLGEGLLTAEGEDHLQQRRHMQPAFHRRRVEEYGRRMVDRAERWQARWEPGAHVAMDEEMHALTLAIAGDTLFGTDVEDEAREIGEAVTIILERVVPKLLIPWARFLERLPLPTMRLFEREKARLDAIVHRLIRERRRSGEERGDVLSLLVHGSDPPMPDRRIRDHVMTLLLAGHETTALALTWSWYLLGLNPEAERAMHEELDAVLGDRAPAPEDLPRLEVTRRILAESMRLYPPAWIVSREVVEPWDVRGYSVPPGAVVITSPLVVHRRPELHPDPLRFDLARWTPQAEAARPRFAYFPFGGGPRQCIGESFAWTEGILTLATIGRRWRPRVVPDHPVSLLPVVTLRPKHGIRMVLERR